MKSSRQSRTTWIALLACLLVALLPSGGLAFCFGHGGDHFAIGTVASLTGAAEETRACPCQSAGIPGSMEVVGSAVGAAAGAGAAADADAGKRHPPCRDAVIEAPPLYSAGQVATPDLATLDLATSPDTDGGSPPWPPLSAILPPLRAAGNGVNRPPAAWLGTLVSPALRAGRTIILLI